MATPQLDAEQIAWLGGAVAEYIEVQRTRYAPRTTPLTVSQRAAMNGFFPAAVLDTGLVELQNERVPNPEFYRALAAMGFQNLPDLTMSGAITLVTVVVSHRGFSNGLLFHELVHVEQYRQ